MHCQQPAALKHKGIDMAELNRRTAVVNAIRRIAAAVLADGYDGDVFAVAQEMRGIDAHFERFSTIQDTLIGAATEAGELEAHEGLGQEIETIYKRAMAALHRRHSELVRVEEPIGDASSVAMSRSNTMAEFRLDPLAVPKFDGTLKNWLAFKDAFETLVHDRELPEAYKLGKLREAVKGDAIQLVGGMYSGGYADVWKALTDRYDNPKQLADIHVARFIGLKQPSTETTGALLSTVDTVREALRALRVMKLPVDQWDALAVPIVTSKLHHSTQQAWGMSRTTNDIPTLEELLTFIERRAHSLASDVLHWPSSSASTTTSSGSRSSGNTSAHLRRSVKTNLVANAPDECHLCPGTIHAIVRCPSFLKLTPFERFRALKGSNYCFNCLRQEHSARECTASRCRKCNQKHHTLLHRDSPQEPSGTTGSGPTPQTSSNSAASSTPAASISNQPPRNHTQ